LLDDGRVGALRGAASPRAGRTLGLSVGTVILVLFAIVIVVSFVSAARDNARIDRLKDRGIAVNVRVSSCVGNLGGSGSNIANYTCQGSYEVKGHSYNEVIGGKSTFSPPGSQVRAVVDPSKYSTVELASALSVARASSTRYVAPIILVVVLVVLAGGLVLVARRTKRFDETPTRE